MEENPIDKDKVTEEPGTLAYPHHVGSPVIKPEDKGKIKGRAMAAMVQQTDKQLEQIYGQIKVLADQANAIKKRIEVSQMIYDAEIGFEPLVGHTYYLYEKQNGSFLVSMIGPNEWGRSFPFKALISGARLLADHTWQLLED